MTDYEYCENDPKVVNIARKMFNHDGPRFVLIELLSVAELSDIAELSTETMALMHFLESEGYSEDTDLKDKNGECVYLAITRGVPDMPESRKALLDVCKYFGESDLRFDADKHGYRYCIVPYFRKELLKDRLSELCSI